MSAVMRETEPTIDDLRAQIGAKESERGRALALKAEAQSDADRSRATSGRVPEFEAKVQALHEARLSGDAKTVQRLDAAQKDLDDVRDMADRAELAERAALAMVKKFDAAVAAADEQIAHLQGEVAKLIGASLEGKALEVHRAWRKAECERIAREYAKAFGTVLAMERIAASLGVTLTVSTADSPVVCPLPATSMLRWSAEPGQAVRELSVVQVDVRHEIAAVAAEVEARLRGELALPQ